MTAGGTVGGRQPVLIRMPAPEKAPGFLDGLRSMALMRVNELDADWLAIEPAEGAGRVRDYFALSRLADSSTAVSDASWDRLRENPPWHSGIDELPQRSGPRG